MDTRYHDHPILPHIFSIYQQFSNGLPLTGTTYLCGFASQTRGKKLSLSTFEQIAKNRDPTARIAPFDCIYLRFFAVCCIRPGTAQEVYFQQAQFERRACLQPGVLYLPG